MIVLNLEVVLTLLSIVTIVVSAILFLIRLSNRVTVALNSININMETMSEDLTELKGYRKDIDKNREDIIKLQGSKADQSALDEVKNSLTIIETQHNANHKGA